MKYDIRTNTAIWNEARKRWEIRVQRNGEPQKRFTSTTPGRAGQKKANAKADAWLNGEAKNGDKRIKLKDAINEWALNRAAIVATKNGDTPPANADALSRQELGSYRGDIGRLKNWLLPDRGSRWVDTICDDDIQNVLDRAAAKGRSRKTIQDIRASIFQFIKFCRRKKYTRYVPEEVDIPRSARSGKRTILQLEDITTLFSSDKTVHRGQVVADCLIHAYRLAVLCGIRPGELMGLEWSDWIAEDILRISRSINDLGEVTLGKNDNALRDVRLPKLAQAELWAQRQACPEVECRIFSNITSQAYYRNRWNAYCEYNEMTRITPYEMRHTFVSIAQTALPDHLLKSTVGHSKSMDTYGIYGHAFSGIPDKTGILLDGVFEGILTPSE